MSSSNFEASADVTSQYSDYYEDGSSEWRRLSAIDKVDNIVSLCADLPHASVLEIGAGDGSILQGLHDRNFGEELYGVEISESGVEATKNRGIENLVDCRLFNGYELPFEDGQVDLAVLSHVVEHVEYPRKLIREAMRTAKHLFVEVPLEHTFRLGQDYAPNKVGHINFYSPKTIRRLLQTCGLQVVRQEITNPSRRVLEFAVGRRGIAQHAIRELLLKAAPQVAPGLFCYHAALVCKQP